MKRNLLTQIKNEWRDNLWLVIELAIVAVAIWALSFTLYDTLRPKFDDKGYDIDNVYKITLKSLGKDSPKYVDMGDRTETANLDDGKTLMARIRKSPYVEIAAFSNNALPYQFSYAGNQLDVQDKGDSVFYMGNLRMASPEIAGVLRIRSTQNLSLKDLEEILRRGDLLVSTAPDYSYGGVKDLKDLVGGRVMPYDTLHTRRIGGVIKSIKRNEYEQKTGTIIFPIDESDYKRLAYCSEIAVRVKPGTGKKFEEEFYSDKSMRQLRNRYLTDLSRMEDVRAANQHYSDSMVRLWSAGIVFLLVIIFLGLLGTFWFRIRQRSGEIALRKTCGATSADIFRRIIGEGMILLSIALIPALIAGAAIYRFIIIEKGFPFDEYKYVIALSFLIMAVIMAAMIVAGTVFPARKAMKTEPAIALKEE